LRRCCTIKLTETLYHKNIHLHTLHLAINLYFKLNKLAIKCENKHFFFPLFFKGCFNSNSIWFQLESNAWKWMTSEILKALVGVYWHLFAHFICHDSSFNALLNVSKQDLFHKFFLSLRFSIMTAVTFTLLTWLLLTITNYYCSLSDWLSALPLEKVLAYLLIWDLISP